MQRREFITLLGGAATLPLVARAQQPDRVRRIGVLVVGFAQSDREGQARIAAFFDTLRKLGWADNRNVRIEYHWVADDPDHVKASASELVRSAPDVIVAMSNLLLVELHRVTSTIPIVFAQVSDPVGSGIVAQLARPGGNITGFANFEPEMGGKWLGLLKEAAPTTRRVAVVFGSDAPAIVALLRAAEAVAPTLQVEVTAVDLQGSAEIEHAIADFARQPDEFKLRAGRHCRAGCRLARVMIASLLAASDLAAAGEGSAQLPIFLAESHAAASQQVNSLASIVKAVLAEALAREEGFKQRGTSRIALPYASFPLPICLFEHGLCGAVNRDGSIAVAPRFDFVDEFHEGRAVVRSAGLYGYVDENGNVVVEPQYMIAGRYRLGVAEVDVDGRSALIDLQGKQVLEPRFAGAVPFTKTVFWVNDGVRDSGLRPPGAALPPPGAEELPNVEFTNKGNSFRSKRLTEKKAGDFGPVVIPSCLRFDEEAQHGLDQNHP